jgi:hypothetical protein
VTDFSQSLFNDINTAAWFIAETPPLQLQKISLSDVFS